ncbi:hypothetical protein OS493_003784 [Desmophyllum pertusum]|uniref:EGF-like domain-containing protein n=1 Tax=Desmophyllum pertusum TaxID=174260 RepID=A0A9X0DB68_9CNID|nr:hypothetical protein OS493_003784 [Desmophyllum pertusum]
MDELLPDVFLDAVQIVLFCIGAVVLPSILNPWIILPATPLMIIFILIGRYFLKTSRDLRRLEGINRSPVLSHFSDTLMGLVTIRAYKREDAFLKALYRYQDDHNRTWFSIQSTKRWLSIRLDMICVIFVTSVVFLAIANQSDSDDSHKQRGDLPDSIQSHPIEECGAEIERQSYCHHGTCFDFADLDEGDSLKGPHCICQEGYRGRRCQWRKLIHE